MSLKEYTVLINDIEHTMELNDEDAARLDAKPKSDKPATVKAATAHNKARTAANK